MPLIQLHHSENIRSHRCPQFSNTTVRMSGLAAAPISALPLWKGDSSQIPPPQFIHVSHVDLFQIIAQTARWRVVTCSLYNIWPLLNSILKPEQTFSDMVTGHLHNVLFVGDFFSVEMNFLCISCGWCGCVLCGTNPLPSNVHIHMWIIICVLLFHSSSVSCVKTLSVDVHTELTSVN
jgi:hypothetical protein